MKPDGSEGRSPYLWSEDRLLRLERLGTALPPPPARGKKRRLGEILIDAGLIDELQLKAALSEQRKWGGKLGRTLVEMNFVDEESMAAALSRQLNLPRVDLDRMQLPADVVQWLRVDIAERYGVFPLGGDAKHKTLQIATSDPTNVEALQELAFHSGFRIITSVAGSTAIDKAIRHYYYGERIDSVPTATPQSLGIPEMQLAPTSHGGPSLQATPPRATPASAVPPPLPPPLDPLEQTQPTPQSAVDLALQLRELNDRLASLEKHAANQVRALRGLFELLVEKGYVTRDEYLNKVRIKD